MIGNAYLLSRLDTKLWVVQDIAQSRYFRGHEPRAITEQYCRVECAYTATLRFRRMLIGCLSERPLKTEEH